jgi:hypothetical protein
MAEVQEGVRTPRTAAEFRAGLLSAGAPSSAVPSLLALLALEHRSKQDKAPGVYSSVWGHNWGNIVASGGSDQPSQRLPGNALRFRVFGSHQEGARAFVDLMNRKPSLMAAAKSGNTEAFVREYQTKWLGGRLPDAGRASLASLVRGFGGSWLAPETGVAPAIGSGALVLALLWGLSQTRGIS